MLRAAGGGAHSGTPSLPPTPEPPAQRGQYHNAPSHATRASHAPPPPPPAAAPPPATYYPPPAPAPYTSSAPAPYPDSGFTDSEVSVPLQRQAAAPRKSAQEPPQPQSYGGQTLVSMSDATFSEGRPESVAYSEDIMDHQEEAPQRLPVFPTGAIPSTAIDQAVAALSHPNTTMDGVNAALRVITKECGLGNATAVCEAGGINAIVTALGRNAATPATAADSCLVLGMITQESDAAELALLSPSVTDGTAVITVMSALQAHTDVMALQATGAWALWGLVRNSKENCMRAISMGAPETLVAAMAAHEGSPEVAQSAAGALLAIAMAGKWAQDAVARADGPLAVKQVMRLHPTISFKGEFDALRDWLRTSTAGR